MDDWLSEVELSVAGEGLALRVEAMDRTGSWLKREYAAPGREHDHYLDLFQAVAADFATRTPLARTPAPSRPAHPALTPVLTEPVHADVLYGYGDPAVMRVETLEGPRWWLYVTSN
ncbi:MAG TPA: hypothetical protein VGB49_01015, partial [Caulobacteraceae bacterium]